MIIIGIDPGSRYTGYGIIDAQHNKNTYLASGCITLTNKNTPEKLQQIFIDLQEVMAIYQPAEAAIEQIFMHENPNSALKLGQARGAAIVALKIPVAEYSARQVKQSVVGYGAAKKEQVQHMVSQLLDIKHKLQADEADALAIALCHGHSRFVLDKIPELLKSANKRRSSWRHYAKT